MPSIETSSQPTASPATAGRTPIQATGSLSILKRPDGSVIAPFNQGRYAGTDSVLPVPDTKGNPRKISGSGCGLCALVSYLNAAGMKAPTLDTSTGAFVIDASSPAIDPASFNQFLIRYVGSIADDELPRTTWTRRIFAPDGAGALNYNPYVIDAINVLVKANIRWTSDGADEEGDAPTFAMDTKAIVSTAAPVGRPIAELTEHLDSGEPAICGVQFNGEPRNAHQVLVVGYATIGDKVFYAMVDSGFAPMDVDSISRKTSPIAATELRLHCASMDRRMKVSAIGWVRRLSGLQSLTSLSMVSP